MKIVFNTGQIYLHGGIEKVMSIKANYFAKQKGYKVYIVTHSQENKINRYPLEANIELIDLGINYDRNHSHFTKNNLKKSILHYKRQKRLFKKLNPDFIIYPNQTFDFYWLPYIKRGAKLIKEIHSSGFIKKEDIKNDSRYKRLKMKLDSYFLGKYDSIVVLNSDEKKYIKKDQVTVIPNPIENTPLSASLANKQVMAAGRIAPVKRFDELISIWKEIHRVAPEWELHIYGEDYINTLSSLKKQVKSLDLEGVVYFKGSTDNLPLQMTTYSLYLMTSATECFPMVLLEALTVGLPVVSYRSPHGPQNIISSGEDGILIEMNNKKEFIQTVINLIEHRDKRIIMGRKAKINAKKFEVKSIMKSWVTLFEKLKPQKA